MLKCAKISGWKLDKEQDLHSLRLSPQNIRLAKKFVQVFGSLWQKNPNELFGQPSIC